MTKKTRYFMAGSAAVLGVGLCTGLIAFYAGGFEAVSAAPVANELRYVPANSTVIAYADVRSIMDSELRTKLKAAIPMHEQGQAEFLAQTGIDIERDIDYIVAAGSTGNTQAPLAGGLVVARGRFNDTQLEALAREHGGQVEDYKGKRLIHSPANESGHQMTLAFLEAGLVAIGTKTTVQGAIDAQLTSHSITSNAEMMGIVADIASNNNAWAVGRFDAIAAQANLPTEIASRMPPVKWFSAAGHVNGGITGTLRAEATDEASADLLRRQVSGVLALGEMVAKSDPTAGALIKSLQMSGSGKTVALSFALPAEVLALIPQMAGAHQQIQ
ncbi:MAG: hypothetical protein M3541_00135 [Acidobacteriota bacterium]|nr:hypothetical protein [Acidobacteriota bacterium]MDQ3417192.1 hypothetical protein [Acidobacteriota bacterium]